MKNKCSISSLLLFSIRGILLTSFMIIFFSSCNYKGVNNQYFADVLIDVDTSKLEPNQDHFTVVQKDTILQVISVGGYLSSREAHSGTHSVLLTGKKAFAFTTTYKYLKMDEHFVISIWRKDPSGKAALVVQGNKTKSLYIAQSEAVEKGENGWERLEIEVEVPSNNNMFSVYAWKINADSAYFDDLEIKQLPPKTYPTYASEEKLHIYFSDAKMAKFEEKRFDAFENGILISDEDWMKGVMSDEENVMPIKARLKGDWLDHLRGRKWSLRIKMQDDFAFKRMRVFSIQNPITRYYLNEYVSHQLFDNIDVLTPRYGFIPVYLNGASLGIYAYEEHFAKQLLEYNLRREGPIVKFDEDPFWRVQQQFIVGKNWVNYPYYETSRIIAFGLGKLNEKPSLAKQFDIAQGLMYQYKDAQASIDEIFNIEVFAKYWAMTDITNGRHGKAWHNQRMYYNPVLCKLEPINYDNYTEDYKKFLPAGISALSFTPNESLDKEHILLNHTFGNARFMELYIHYLEKYSDANWILQFMDSEKENLDRSEALLQQEFKDYQFDRDFLLNNAALIREQLPELKKKYADGFFQDLKFQAIPKTADTGFYPLLIGNYVNAFYFTEEENRAQLKLENYSGRTMEIVGLADKDGRMIYLLPESIYLKPYANQVDEKAISSIYLPKASQLAFRVNGHDDIFYSELSLWKKNTDLSPYQKMQRASAWLESGLFEERGDSLLVKKGNYILNQKILIPSDKLVVFEAGVELDMVQQAAFISQSTVRMMGTEKSPIRIFSSDSTANSFTVLQASERSELHYVTFSNLNTFSYEGWAFSGAVFFYESDVLINNCTIENNHCEDALNIVRSDFEVTETYFSHIYADAFDSDFSTGTLDKSVFKNVDNDAIDFSTSQINISNCKMNGIGDKGISGGEGSTLKVSNTQLINCNIGAASKDLSLVELNDVLIDSCNYGLVALIKKPEYGPGTFITNNLKLLNCKTPHLIEENSVLILNGRKIQGTVKNGAELFY